MIFVLYGQSGSGKTELGRKISQYIGTDLVIDGDEIRDIFSNKNRLNYIFLIFKT